ncbi:MAG: 2-oxoglutarate dehydrogenase E1 subunit family protein, partial [Flavobacteriales bacterium]
MDPLDFISQAEPQAIESLYQQYRSNPNSVDASWRLFFKGF